MARELKVWTGLEMRQGENRQVRVIVVARTKKAAVEALNAAVGDMSMHYFSTYWSGTENETDRKVAERYPEGTVLWCPEQYSRNARQWADWSCGVDRDVDDGMNPTPYCRTCGKINGHALDGSVCGVE